MSAGLYLAGQILDPDTNDFIDQYGARLVAAGDFLAIKGSFPCVILTADLQFKFVGFNSNAAWPIPDNSPSSGYGTVVNLPNPTGGATWTTNYSVRNNRLMAIDSFGRLWAFGDYSIFVDTQAQVTLVNDTKTWIDCSVGFGGMFIAVNTAGEVWTGGNNSNGQCGRGSVGGTLSWALVQTNSFRKCLSGGLSTVAMTEDGGLYNCGWDFYGQLGRGGMATARSTLEFVRFSPAAAALTQLRAADRVTGYETSAGLLLAGSGLGVSSSTFVTPESPVSDLPLLEYKDFGYLNNAGAVVVNGSNTNGRLGQSSDVFLTDGYVSFPLVGPANQMQFEANTTAVLLTGPPPLLPRFWRNYAKTQEL